MCASTRFFRLIQLMATALTLIAQSSMADDFDLTLRSVRMTTNGVLEYGIEKQTWNTQKTAIIICDTWDYHHSLNAARRLEQFAPRMNQVVSEARKRGAVVIHAPSDCMPSYTGHPARERAIAAPVSPKPPADVAAWCSKIPEEETATYPIDQSDGGDDDDPKEHTVWANKLKALGRNPSLPWQRQSDLIEIDSQLDFISDRGDEVWNILTDRQIQQVILVGVHTNMCVLGRPFGLRQMARNGMKVVLMRDMTDCMYNPACWPFVDHFTGNDLVISHVERFVCPTITSDQIIGGIPFHFREDKRASNQSDLLANLNKPESVDLEKQWTLVSIPIELSKISNGSNAEQGSAAWARCTVRFPRTVLESSRWSLTVSCRPESVSAWLNGKPMIPISTGTLTAKQSFEVPSEAIYDNEANLLVLRIDHQKTDVFADPPTLTAGATKLELKGRWQLRLGDDKSWSTIPLPAKFGMPPDIFHELRNRN